MAKIKSKVFQLRKEYELKEGRRVPLIEVAEKTGIDRKTLARMEQDEEIERMDMGVLKRLCAFYGVGVGDILEYDPNGQRGLNLAPLAASPG
jgi:putative transcriptional regulator